MQNKANFRNGQMNVNLNKIKDYGDFRPYGRRKNKANFKGRSQKTEGRMQEKINMCKYLSNKEIRPLFLRLIPLMTLCILSGIGIKTKPIRTQNEPKRTQLKPILSQNEPNSKPKQSQYAGLWPEILSTKLVLSEVEWIRNPKQEEWIPNDRERI